MSTTMTNDSKTKWKWHLPWGLAVLFCLGKATVALLLQTFCSQTRTRTLTLLCQVFWHVFKWELQKQQRKKKEKDKKLRDWGIKKENIAIKAKCEDSSYASHSKTERSRGERANEEGTGGGNRKIKRADSSPLHTPDERGAVRMRRAWSSVGTCALSKLLSRHKLLVSDQVLSLHVAFCWLLSVAWVRCFFFVFVVFFNFVFL